MEPSNTQESSSPGFLREANRWKGDVKRLVRRKMISETRAASLSSLKRQVRKRENDLGVDQSLDELASGELIIDPKMVQVAEFLSGNLRERFPEVEGVVLLGSSVHGGSKIREFTGNTEPDLDWGIVTDRIIEPARAKEINAEAEKQKEEIVARFGLDEGFHLCPTANPIQYRVLNLHDPEQIVELFRLRHMTDSEGRGSAAMQLLPGRQAVLYLQPSFPPEVNEGNREILLEGLRELARRWPSLWENSIHEILIAWKNSHKLKDKHFKTAGRGKDRELVYKVIDESSSWIMGKSLEQLLWSTGDGAPDIKDTETPKDNYQSLIELIQLNPYDDQLWERVVNLARKEEDLGNHVESSETYYSKIPLDELILIGESLRATRSRSKQYEILMQKSSTGELWYDIILGHVNDRAFAPIAEEIERLVKQKGSKFEDGLDVGCGTGNTIRAIAPYFEDVVGIDIEDSIVQAVKKEGSLPSNAAIMVGDAIDLPVGDEYFDIAVSNGLTHYLSEEEMKRYIHEIARVLTPGGLYFESFVQKADDELLPKTEQDYLSSAKAVLICLMDNLVSQTSDNSQIGWNFKGMVDEFRSLGFNFDFSAPNEEGVVFVQFQKPEN